MIGLIRRSLLATAAPTLKIGCLTDMSGPPRDNGACLMVKHRLRMVDDKTNVRGLDCPRAKSASAKRATATRGYPGCSLNIVKDLAP